jgi:hypothetical protein
VNGNSPKHLRNAWLTACSALLLALTGCGGTDEPPESGPRIDAAAASQLAEQSEEIAQLIDDGQVCDAAHAADELKAQAEAEIADGSVPAPLANELVSNAQALVDEVNCDAPEPPPATTDEDDDDEEKEGDGEGKGKGNGKDKGKGRDKDGDG